MISALLLAQAAAVMPEPKPQKVLASIDRPKTGSIRCELRSKDGREIRFGGSMSQTESREDKPAQPQMSVRSVGDAALDGEYLGWFTASNGSFSFSNVNTETHSLVTLTFFGVSWFAQRVAVVASIEPIGNGYQTFLVGFCQSQWKR